MTCPTPQGKSCPLAARASGLARRFRLQSAVARICGIRAGFAAIRSGRSPFLIVMAEEHAAPASLTGRPRRRRTSPIVRWGDRIARWAIAAGGIGTIAAVSIVCVFLVYVVVPLFEPASIDHPASLAPPEKDGAGQNRPRRISEHWLGLYPDGKLYCFLLADGRPLGQPREIKGSGKGDSARLTASSFAADSETCAFGFQDGGLQTGRIGFKTSFLRPSAVPETIRGLKPGETVPLESGVVSRTPEGQFRQETMEVTLDPPVEAASKSPIVQISFASRSEGPLVCTYSADLMRITSRITSAETRSPSIGR